MLTITLLAASSDSGPRGGCVADRDPAQGTGRLRVLVVEDEFLISLELEGMLTDLGADVVGLAATAEEAVRLAGELRPDLLTMDVNLASRRDGVSAALEIFERFGMRSLFISAYGDAATMERAREAKPLGWIEKPVSRGDLRAKLPLRPN